MERPDPAPAWFALSEPGFARIRITDLKLPRIEAETVAAALGAERTEVALEGQGPFSLFVLRQDLRSRMQSGGGRPGLQGATRRQKIPLSDAEWTKLQRLAGVCRSAGVRTSAGQIASVLLHRVLEQVDEQTVLSDLGER